jgi:hypothetical protein
MTIEVLTVSRDGGTEAVATFTDIVEAARYALRIANDHGLAHTISMPTNPPVEICVMDEGKIALALKVQVGGLVPPTGQRQPSA